MHLNTTEAVLYSLIDVICQLTLVHRCWKLYKYNFLVTIIPASIALISFGCELGTAALLASPNAQNMLPKIVNLGTGGFTASLVCNVVIMSLISTKIWAISRDVPNRSRSSLKTLLAIVLESGLIIAVAQLLWLVLFRVDNDAGYNVVAGAITQVYGITPTILAIRVAIGASFDNEPQAGSMVPLHVIRGSQTPDKGYSEEV